VHASTLDPLAAMQPSDFMEALHQQTGLVMHTQIHLIKRIRKPATLTKPCLCPVTSIVLAVLSLAASVELHQCNLPIVATTPMVPLLACVAWAERAEYRRARAHYDGWHAEMAELMRPRPAPRWESPGQAGALMTPLMDAAHLGNARRVRRLLAHGADPRSATPDDATALGEARAFPLSTHHRRCADLLHEAICDWDRHDLSAVAHRRGPHLQRLM